MRGKTTGGARLIRGGQPGTLFALLFVTMLIISGFSGEAAEGPATGSPPAIYPVEAVRPGLEGVGYTVVRGTKVEQFPVEILGLVKQAGPSGSDLVLVRVGGVVRAAGGIAAGMSGSPVYVGDQLLGAIGYGFELSDPSLGLVTPAAEMAKVLARAKGEPEKAGSSETTNQTKARSDRPGGFESVVVASSPAEGRAWQQRFGAGVAVFVPVATPVLVNGLGERARKWLQQSLDPYPVVIRSGLGFLSPVAGGARPGDGEEWERLPDLGWWYGEATSGAAGEIGSGESRGSEGGQDQPFPAPGQALAVQLVRGDVDVSALGTVTWVEGDRLVGFGHPFLSKGETHLFLGPAYVVGVVPSISMPFKVGYPLPAVGTLVQDRAAGVAGVIGVLPEYVQVEVKIREKGKQAVTTRADVVWDEELTSGLVGTVLLEAFDRSLDRVGRGTAQVKLQARVDGMQLPVIRTNLFASRADIAAAAVSEATELVDRIAANPFRAARPTRLVVEADVDPEPKVAMIERVYAPSRPVKPGDRVELRVRLRPFRGEVETRLLVLELPEDLAPGVLTVTVRGGSGFVESLPAKPGPQGGEPGGEAPHGSALLEEGPTPPESLEEWLEEFTKREKNNDLVAEYWPESAKAGATGAMKEADSTPPSEKSSDGKGGADPGLEAWRAIVERAEKEVGPSQPVKVILPTPYVIEGWIEVDLEIAEPKAKAEAATEQADQSTEPGAGDSQPRETDHDS